MPASETRTAAASSTPSPGPAAVKSSSIPADNIPLAPPPPSAAPAPPPAAGAVTPPAPPPPAAPKKRGVFRRLYNLVVSLLFLGALAFGGGVWYSRVNDNFHDFFTEYIPFGEQAVLYLEELVFRKRFPNISNRIPGGRPRDTGDSVKIPAQSGASWREADSGEPAGRQSSALSRKQPATPAAEKTKDEAPKQTKSTPGKKEEPKAEAPKAPQPAAA